MYDPIAEAKLVVDVAKCWISPELPSRELRCAKIKEKCVNGKFDAVGIDGMNWKTVHDPWCDDWGVSSPGILERCGFLLGARSSANIARGKFASGGIHFGGCVMSRVLCRYAIPGWFINLEKKGMVGPQTCCSTLVNKALNLVSLPTFIFATSRHAVVTP